MDRMKYVLDGQETKSYLFQRNDHFKGTKKILNLSLAV